MAWGPRPCFTASCSLNCLINFPSRVLISCMVNSSPALEKEERSLSRCLEVISIMCWMSWHCFMAADTRTLSPAISLALASSVAD